MESLSNIENNVSLTKTKVTNLSLTNINLQTKKDRVEMYVKKVQGIMNNWAHSHHKLSKIIDTQIPDQCEKILSGNIIEDVNIYKQIEIEENFPSSHDRKEYFRSRFVIHSFINQSLITKHYTTNPNGFTVCTTRITALDPTIKIHAFDIPTPTTGIYLKFPISNGEFHSTHDILNEFLECIVICHDTDNSHSSNTDESHHTILSQNYSFGKSGKRFSV